jgi:hypothetical protein
MSLESKSTLTIIISAIALFLSFATIIFGSGALYQKAQESDRRHDETAIMIDRLKAEQKADMRDLKADMNTAFAKINDRLDRGMIYVPPGQPHKQP